MSLASNAGEKRKRYEPPEVELSVRIGGKIHHEKKEVHRASKRAKVFETQKVVKKLKDLRKKNEDAKVVEDELNSLKVTDHDAIGNSAFRSKVLKDHALRDHKDVKAAMTKELESNLVISAEAGSTLARIQSRLLSSKLLAIQVAASVESLKVLLNPALKQRENTLDANFDTTLERPTKQRKESNVALSSTTQPKKATPKPRPHLVSVEDGLSDLVDEAGWESGSINEEPAEDNDGWDSASIASGASGKGGESDDDSGEEQDSDQESISDDEELKPQSSMKNQIKTITNKKISSSTGQSTFLPSLSVGFIRGSDGSDFSEDEGKGGDMPKKNRRGQRARRAIWEKKFGRNANHKKKEAEDRAAAPTWKPPSHTSKIKTGSNAIHAATAPTTSRGPRGTTGQGDTKGNNIPQRQQPPDAGWGSRSSGPITNGSRSSVTPLQQAPKNSTSRFDRNDEKPLHPSWEAKRKLKEKESFGIVPSQGKKIKF